MFERTATEAMNQAHARMERLAAEGSAAPEAYAHSRSRPHLASFPLVGLAGVRVAVRRADACHRRVDRRYGGVSIHDSPRRAAHGAARGAGALEVSQGKPGTSGAHELRARLWRTATSGSSAKTYLITSPANSKRRFRPRGRDRIPDGTSWRRLELPTNSNPQL